ncbi:MAG: hypothetical protein WCQ50_12865 [Spirochaetota bacterium]
MRTKVPAFIVMILAAAFVAGAESPSPAGDQVVTPPAEAGSQFRFLPEGPWFPFDRVLRLLASPGEERQYSYEVRTGTSVARRDELVDRRAPPGPLASPLPGLYRDALAINLSGEMGSELRFSLSDALSGNRPFETFRPGTPIVLPASAENVHTWVLIAYAIDRAGNRGQEARFVYRIAPRGLPATSLAPVPTRTALLADPQLDPGTPTIAVTEGRSTISFPVPAKGRLMAAVNPGSALSVQDAWVAMPIKDSAATLTLECPYGWAGLLDAYIGIELDGSLRYRPLPFKLQLSAQGLPAYVSPSPEAPRLMAGAPGADSYLVFPRYEGTIYYGLDGGAEVAYSDPLVVSAATGQLRVGWRGVAAFAVSSDRREIQLARPAPAVAVSFPGINGSTSAQPLHLKAPEGTTIRYVMTDDGSFPAEPDATSPILGTDLTIDANQGSTRRLVFRYRVFAGVGLEAGGDDGGILRFVIDHEPPPRPTLASDAPAYSRAVMFLDLRAAEGRLFTAIAEEGGAALVREPAGPIELPGSPQGPRVWTVLAWTVDSVGNRSQNLGPLRFVIDTSTIYLDSSFKGVAQGTPEAPCLDLASALDLARRTTRSVIRVRGDLALPDSLAVEGMTLSVDGGYGTDWMAAKKGRSIINLPSPRPGLVPITIQAGTLSLTSLDLRPALGEGRLISTNDSTLEISDCLVRASTSRDLVLVSGKSSSLRIKDSSLRLEGSGGGALVAMEGGDTDVSSCTLASAPELAWFSGLSQKGGRLALIDSTLDSSAAVNLVGISVEKGSFLGNALRIRLSGEAGYFRLGSFTSATGELLNSHIEVDRRSASTLFSLSASPLAFVHDTMVFAAGSILVFDAIGGSPRIINDLFIASGGKASLLRTDKKPEAGSIAASAFGGFDRLGSGAWDAADVTSVQRLNSGIAVPPSLALPSGQAVFQALKGGYALLPGSPVIDAALPLDDPVYRRDFSGLLRPSSGGSEKPDIGADELQ